MKKTLDRALTLLLAVCLVFALATPAAAAGPSMSNFTRSVPYTPGQFRDVPADAWYGDNSQQTVRLIYELGLMDGAADGIFDPEAPVTLAQAITMAVRINRIYWNETEPMPEATPWYEPYVLYAIASGIIYEGDFTDYNAYATRWEMAYIFSAAIPRVELAAIRTVDSIPDVENTDYNRCVYSLYEAGVISGNDDYGTFGPDTYIQRAAAAAIAARIALPSQRSAAPLLAKEDTPTSAPPEQSVYPLWSDYYTAGMRVDTRDQLRELLTVACYNIEPSFTFNILDSTLEQVLSDPLILNTYSSYASYSWGGYAPAGYTSFTLDLTYPTYLKLTAAYLNPALGSKLTSSERTWAAKAASLASSCCDESMTDYEKAKAVHDYMVANYYYDNEALNHQNDPAWARSWDMSGLLDYGTGVCEAYAELYAYLMTTMGIPAQVVVGRAGGDHAWNMIELDGAWYHVDVTWDDPVPDRPGRVVQSYFCLTDSEMSRDHSWNAGDYPACNGTVY